MSFSHGQMSSESRKTVKGPSFSSKTFMSAPNSPDWTEGQACFAFWIKYPYRSFAISGLPASVKEGRFPLRQLA